MRILLVLLLLVSGCASTSTPLDRPRQPDPCTSQGGVWWKGTMDTEYRCVDEKGVREALRHVQQRYF
jgi:uncharacterized protein YceK